MNKLSSDRSVIISHWPLLHIPGTLGFINFKLEMNFPRMNYATENENEKKKNHHEFSHL